jgi:hypothetical protein
MATTGGAMAVPDSSIDFARPHSLGTIGLTDEGSIDITPAGAATLMVIAFLIGYRERTFRLLIERVVDTIFGPGSDTEASGPTTCCQPSSTSETSRSTRARA